MIFKITCKTCRKIVELDAADFSVMKNEDLAYCEACVPKKEVKKLKVVPKEEVKE